MPLPAQPLRVAVSGSRAFVANGAGGLLAIDISDPTRPLRAGGLPLAGAAQGVAAAGPQVYVAAGSGGVNVVDGSGAPQLSATLATAAVVYDAADSDGAALLAARDGLRVVDLSQPNNPVLVGYLATSEPLAGVAAVGGVAYLAAGRAGLLLADVSQPAQPALLSTTDTPGNAHAVAVAGSTAYVADGLAGVQIFGVANPQAPQQLATFDTPGDTRDVFVSGGRAYLADWDRGLRILDVSDPANPQELGLYNTAGEAAGVAAAGDYAYVADSLSGLRIIDVSNPALPHEVAALVTQRVVSDLALVGGYIYLTNDDLGLTVVDVSQPAAPRVVGSYDTAGRAWGVNLTADGRILLADWLGGLYVFNDLFAISGAVRQANGLPFPGVTVSLTGGGTQQVGGSGHYAFSDLPFGVYAVEPGLDGYVFLPPAAQVALPPSPAAIDFTILRPPTSTLVPLNTPLTWTVDDTQGLPTQFHFPAGSGNAALTVLVTPTVAATGGGLVFAGHAWELAVVASGVTQPEFLFNLPVSVTVSYSDFDVSNVGDEAALGLYRWSGSAWAPAGGECTPPVDQNVDADTNQLAATFCRSGTFALFGNPGRVYLPLARVGP